ncbi:MAG: hypothetical protein K0U33_03825 [Bacteroidetes bacterium]|jgi:hypothetical protein|nr:hypothetical protein [Crocinitomicaceae bacterium]MCH9822468.1 hypothetical protein [Bacteroidota bacterium]|tara:strand:+ start:55943 stop:56257 length:315 start_codon:yes stop_codon:yes gene_type:complete
MKELDSVLKIYKKEGFESEKLITALIELREVFKAAGNPTLTKVTRFVYEYIQENKTFDIDVFEERSEDDETSFEYLLMLMSKADNPLNLEEIQEYKGLLIEARA